MSVGFRAVVALLVASMFALAASPECAAQSTQQADENVASRWATQNYEDVSKHVFGSPTSLDGLDLNIAWVVTARVRPAHDPDPEVQFSLTKLGNGEVNAVVTKLRSSLQGQLQNLHDEHRSATPSEIAKLVDFDRFVLTQTQCPALTKIAAAFAKLRTPIAFENALVLDPRQYQLWLDAGSQQVYLNVLGASNGGSRHPIIVWIEETQQRLQKAIAQSHQQRPIPPTR
jgi:hypothetical protein